MLFKFAHFFSQYIAYTSGLLFEFVYNPRHVAVIGSTSLPVEKTMFIIQNMDSTSLQTNKLP